MSRYTFRFKPTIIALFLLSVLLGLGVWQLLRLQWKTALIETATIRATLPPEPIDSLHSVDLNFRSVIVNGHFIKGKTWFLNAPSSRGEGGIRVLSPFVMDGDRTILVDRGWAPWQLLHASPSVFEPYINQMQLVGVLIKPRAAWPRVSKSVTNDHFWTSVDLNEMAQREGVSLSYPYLLINKSPANGDSWLKPDPLTPQLSNPHLGYAITWFTLAFILVVIYGISCRRE